jgi:hypothetical protein
MDKVKAILIVLFVLGVLTICVILPGVWQKEANQQLYGAATQQAQAMGVIEKEADAILEQAQAISSQAETIGEQAGIINEQTHIILDEERKQQNQKNFRDLMLTVGLVLAGIIILVVLIRRVGRQA